MNDTSLVELQLDAQKRYDELTSQINDLNRQIQTLAEERLRIEGEHRVVTKLIENETKEPKKATK